MNDATRIANKVLQEQGYAIVAFFDRANLPKVGTTYSERISGGSGGFVPGPFFVIAAATAEEFFEQARKYAPNPAAAARAAGRAVAFLKVVAE